MLLAFAVSSGAASAVLLVPRHCITLCVIIECVIRSFRDRETERLFNRERVRRLPASLQRTALRKLRILHRAKNLQDLRVPPSNRLEALKGDRRGQYSIRVNDQYRFCFEWKSGDAFHVEIVDYH